MGKKILIRRSIECLFCHKHENVLRGAAICLFICCLLHHQIRMFLDSKIKEVWNEIQVQKSFQTELMVATMADGFFLKFQF
jgi:hypothetical protein